MSDLNDMTGKWDYSKLGVYQYGGPDSYIAGMKFLEGCNTIEDWGCGGGFARGYLPFPSEYIGVDGSPGPRTSIVCDLRRRHSMPDGIFMRHVLEHNRDWKAVLRSAIRSFQKKMVLILFLKLGDKMKVLGCGEPRGQPKGIYLSLCYRGVN